ncbi:MBL fold metallo-hydrolase [Frankia sp. Ag45/Mut15]|uniref:MBL fold metallo-hydrolase n=1 Tax=Frankia umida TaxID=573489 RepID=A0ABT0JT38_9ACTN|nr:alkyl sulfatase dimerization domain-containing protein [Frankia umida]MCK9874540.1 MBL fold metallo-hydrolase [Frankia umida]
MPKGDQLDFEAADRGLIGALEPCVVRDEAGRTVWDNEAFRFLADECPPTVHPSLWRQSRLCARHGLYEVTEGLYQVRGLDLSNMTLVEGERGVVVIDPLVSTETAAAALGLYRRHRGDRPVTAVIYTHPHIDHFGGVAGVVTGGVPIVAPVDFMRHAVTENVYAGGAMLRRGMYHTGASLEPGPRGLVGTGLGQTASAGTVSLIPPTVDVTRTGQEEVLDGVRFVFQMTPGTEAPAEMNFLLPDHRALCLAENATHTLHNVLTLRGAVVRDARVWSRYLQETMILFADEADVAFASHHWPTWGTAAIRAFLADQRDTYAYLHDQTLRLMNLGYTGTEIAELVELDPELTRSWHTHGYYGSVSHNVKAVYQRYLGWFDGNPAHLWEHPPVESARRYVDCIGGVKAVVAKARAYRDDGDLRFAAELLNHAVFADPASEDARDLLADVYTRLGFGAENGTWRNFYLTGAQELRQGTAHGAADVDTTALAGALTIEQILDSFAIRINGPRAWGQAFTLDWAITDQKEIHRSLLSHGALTHWSDPATDAPDATVRLSRAELLGFLGGRIPADDLTVDGDPSVLSRLRSLLDDPNPAFAIVTA